VDRKDHLACSLVDVGDDVRDEGTQQSLPCTHRDARRVPGRGKIRGKVAEVGLDLRLLRRTYVTHTRLARLHAAQGSLPVFLKLGGDQAVVGIACGIPPFGQRRLVFGLLQLQFDDALLLTAHLHVPPLGLDRGLDCDRLDRHQQLPRDGLVDPAAAEGQTSWKRKRLVRAIASVHRLTRFVPSVGHRQPTTAPTAAEQPGKQGSASTAGFCSSGLAVGVGGELFLVTLELLPVDIAVVMVLEHHLPVFHRPSMAVALADAISHQLAALLALPVDVCASVERVLEDRYDVAVADRRPVKRGQTLAIRWPREVDAIGRHRRENLARAAELAELREDQMYCLLQANVRIEAEANVPVPNEPDGHRDPKFAASGLRSGGVEHPSSKHAEFELTDAALHAEQQSIVRPARVVSSIEIDDPSFDEAAKLEEMMPVSSISRQPRSVEAQDGADFARAQPRDQSIESRSGNRAARGAAEVVVDNFDLLEPPTTGDVHEFVLPPLALEIGLDLGLGRLPHVDHGLAPQDRRGKNFSVRHRHAPRRRRRAPAEAGRQDG
jgi:hypothetical protein